MHGFGDTNLTHFKIQAISQGRYSPPCKKTAADRLCELSASAQKDVAMGIKRHVHEECLDICISGKQFSCALIHQLRS